MSFLSISIEEENCDLGGTVDVDDEESDWRSSVWRNLMREECGKTSSTVISDDDEEWREDCTPLVQ